MQLFYGGFPFEANGVEIGVDIQVTQNEAGQPVEENHAWNVVATLLTPTTQAGFAAAVAALGAALAQPYKDLVFKADDGSVAMALRNAGSISGVKITRKSLPGTAGPEFATIRTVTFTAEASYPAFGAAKFVSFRETLTIEGGGPRVDWFESLDRPPQFQVLNRFTVCHAIQAGAAVGYLEYPRFPPPVFPAFVLPDKTRAVVGNPERRGATWINYPIEYSYEFAAPVRLVGIPNRWVG